jgi:outer membrane lipoprotein LolB
LAAACTSVPPAPPHPGGFAVVARVAVRYGDEAASGRVTWSHSDVADDLVFSTPLGQGVAEITRRDSGAYTLVTSNAKRYSASDPELLTKEALGWALPLGGLPDWLQGRPQPGVPSNSRYEGERLAELQQLGWLIEYSAFDESGVLPQRMRLTRGDLDIRLSIDQWQVAPR